MDDLAEKIGRLTGRIEATESRLDRHESYVGSMIKSMNDKLDKLSDQLASSAGRVGVFNLLWTGGGGVALGYVVVKALNVH